jgi:hypothetical protein
MSRIAFELLVGKMDEADGAPPQATNRGHRILLDAELVLRKSA